MEFAHDGITTYYERRGSGRPLMLVAGFAADNAFWLPSADALAARYDLVMPDNRGAGRTTPLDAATSVRAMADDCIALALRIATQQRPVRDWSSLFDRVDRPLWFRNLFYWVLSPALFDNAQAADALVQLAATYRYQQRPTPSRTR